VKVGIKVNNIIVLAPIFPPAPGGGAQYSQFLVDNLPELPGVRKVYLITERWPGMPEKRTIKKKGRESECIILRKLVRFHGLPARLFRRYPAYAIQNLQIIWWLRKLLAQTNENTIVFIHSAFFIHPTLLVGATRSMKKKYNGRIKIVLDCRDPSIPIHRLIQMLDIDAAISCGTRLTKQLVSALPSNISVTQIPVPVDFYDVCKEDVERVMNEYDLNRGGYIFSANGIKNSKDFPLLFDAWRELLNRGQRLDLVVAGDKRDWQSRYQERAITGGRLIYVGPLPNLTIRALMKSAAAVVNPSRAEGLPRSCLESLSLNVPTLLPPDLPEFANLGNEFVVTSREPKTMAQQIGKLIEEHRVAPYDWSIHRASKVQRDYENFISSLF
jgi:glycosyltransferase involved in cell wall biosynthesis